MNTPDFTGAHWVKSSHSSGEGQCVEVAAVPDRIATRDSKNHNGPVLLFRRNDWADFIQSLGASELHG